MGTYQRLELAGAAALLLVTGCYAKWDDQHAEQQQLIAMGVDLTQPVVKGDPARCPAAQLGTLVLPKCCTKDNQCGGDGTMFGYGCSDFADPMFRAYLTAPPEPVACSGGTTKTPGTTGATARGAAGSGGSPAAGAPASGSAGAPAAAVSSGLPSGIMPPANPPAGTLDARCPQFEIMPGVIAKGCCTVDQHCGADGSAMGFGCTDLSSAMFRSLFPNAPPGQTCDGKPL